MERKNQIGFSGILLAILLTVACAQENHSELGSDVANEVVTDLVRAEAATNGDARFAEDHVDDDMRQPAAVLAFIGVKPGSTVFEMEAGHGYYTELLSAIVGDKGAVIMQNPQSFQAFHNETVNARLADGRLANVRLTKSSFDKLDASTASVDMVTWLLGPHELYFTPSDGTSLGGVEPTYAEIFRILKPGGEFVILDHSAGAGASTTTGGTLHRIDPAIVKALTKEAGFEFVEETDILRNPDDHYDMSVFDPVVRRKTDRFLLKYKKPTIGDAE